MYVKKLQNYDLNDILSKVNIGIPVTGHFKQSFLLQIQFVSGFETFCLISFNHDFTKMSMPGP